MTMLANITLAWTMSDATSGVSECQVAIDSEPWILVGLNTSHEFAGLSEGNHTAWLNVTDRAGWFALDNVTFMVDLTPPYAWNSMYSIGETYVWVSWTALDNTSGVADVQVQLDDDSWISMGLEKNNETFSGLEDGNHAVRIRAVDRAGNVGPASTLNFLIDTAPPEIAIVWPGDGQVIDSSSITVTWMMDDALSYVSRAEISLDGGSFMSAGTDESMTLEGLEDGDHTIRLRVIDAMGNTAEETVSFVVEAEAGTSGLVIAAIAVIVIAAVLVVAYVALRRKKTPDDGQKKT